MSLDVRLRNRFRGYAGQVTKLANKNLGDKQKLILVKSTVEEKKGTLTILSIASPKNRSKPVARAYEYGSGTRSRVRSRKSRWQQPDGRILITPKQKKVLAFYWDKVDEDTPAGQKFIGLSPTTGKALMRYVEHPGVEAVNGGRGYLAPAINEVRKRIRQEVSKDVQDEVHAIFKKSFRKK